LIRLLNTFFPSRTVFLGISEACLVTVAFIVAMMARLGPTDAYLTLNYEQGFLKICVVALAFVLCMYYFDLYDSAILSNRREIPTRVMQVLGTVCILMAVLYYLYPPLELGRGIFLLGFLLVLVLVLCWRSLFLLFNSVPTFADRVMIFGEGPLARQLMSELRARPELGLRVVAQVAEAANQCSTPDALNEGGLVEQLARCVELQRINRIVVAMEDRRGKLPVEQLLSLKSHGITVQEGAELYEEATGKVALESFGLGCLLFSRGICVSRRLAYRRVISCFVAVLGILLSIPLVPLIALAIKLTSRGPLLYWQKRVGQDGMVFDFCKFRSMRVDAEANTGAAWATEKDPRVTAVGRFLRSSRLDEIPQLWMVLNGKMNLIGPRPERPEFVERLTQEIPHYRLRHTIRPGITGWAQIRYGYGSSVADAMEKLRYDLFYVKNMSAGLDLLILFHSIKIVLLGRGAK
jgi:sugar transferase (PEP-CTERM system associated)